jgi:hypothetical protein
LNFCTEIISHNKPFVSSTFKLKVSHTKLEVRFSGWFRLERLVLRNKEIVGLSSPRRISRVRTRRRLDKSSTSRRTIRRVNDDNLYMSKRENQS